MLIFNYLIYLNQKLYYFLNTIIVYNKIKTSQIQVY